VIIVRSYGLVKCLAGCAILLSLVGCNAQRAQSDDAPLFVQSFVLNKTDLAPQGQLNDLTLGTYNVHGLSDVQALHDDLEALSFVNVWAFQEVKARLDGQGATDSAQVPPELIHNFTAILPSGTWYGVYVPLNQRDGLWEGQAIVSRWPIAKVDVWPLERTGRKRRIALCAWLDTPLGNIPFINTDHETAWAGIGPDDRAKQVASLVLKLTRETPPAGIVVGDFNTSGDWLGMGAKREIAALVESMDKAGFIPARPDPDAITFHAGLLDLSLDHVFLKNMSCDHQEIYRGKGSDHFPVWCHISKVR
jgi:endonuclease/exonuclease/phosphatase family metal-dependent hydrolase